MNSFSVFEYGEWFQLPDRSQLEPYLIEIWQRFIQTPEEVKNENLQPKQQLLTFDGNKARALNYIGFIHTPDYQIEIYPKVFKHTGFSSDNKRKMLQHIFYWFAYCRKWRFPFSNVNLELESQDCFPELIINLMAAQIRDVISLYPISLYEEVEETLLMPRGKINFGRYAKNGLANGRQNLIDCDYEPLVYDNRLNRIIKNVSRILQNSTRFKETRQILDEVLFILDEVEDVPCIAADLEKVKVNSFFADYVPVMDTCRMVLQQQLYSQNHYHQNQWCLLFPMEYIFEDFVAGFIEHNFPEWIVDYQKSDMYLVNHPHKAFQMQHDIFLTLKGNQQVKIIIDTKYKLRDRGAGNDPKRGVVQSDMYQMVSYAFRRGCKHILLLYPNAGGYENEQDTFQVKSGFSDGKDIIYITAANIPFWTENDFCKEVIEGKLISRFKYLLENIAAQY